MARERGLRIGQPANFSLEAAGLYATFPAFIAHRSSLDPHGARFGRRSINEFVEVLEAEASQAIPGEND